MAQFRFQVGEKLKSRKEIERLFQAGSQACIQYPLRLVWRPMEKRRSEFPVQMTVSVSKKRFKKAVDRNRIKRLVREAYRLQKPQLYERLGAPENQLAWMIIYIGKEMPEYRRIEKSMRKLQGKFFRQYED
ncbi:MAG: ribonuclease P protein component [Bacteroidota bacterium]